MKPLITLRGMARKIGKSPNGTKALIRRAGVAPVAFIGDAMGNAPVMLFDPADVAKLQKLNPKKP